MITRLGEILKPFNAEYDKVAPVWGTTFVMGGFILDFLVFLVIILESYNTSVIFDSVDVDWLTSESLT
jgi:photosystem II PsbH protein